MFGIKKKMFNVRVKIHVQKIYMMPTDAFYMMPTDAYYMMATAYYMMPTELKI